MVCARLHTPSWRQGFARYRHRSAYPGLWDGLVGAWLPALGPTGSTLRDISGYGNHGTLSATMDPATDWVTTRQRGLPWALDFDHTNFDELVNCGTAEVLDLTDQVSLSVWAKSFSADYGIPFGKTAPGYTLPYWQYAIDWNATLDLDFRAEIGGAPVVLVHLETNLIGWNHIVCTYDGTWSHIYLNGVLRASDNTSTGAIGSHPTWPVVIGASEVHNSEKYHWNGGIALASIHDRPVTANEVRQLYTDPLAIVQRRVPVFPTAVVAPVGPTIITNRTLILSA